MKTSVVTGYLLVGMICIGCAGTVLAGKAIPVKELPEKVVNAINKRFPGAELLSAEKDTEDGKLYYEVQIRDKKGHWEVEVSPKGKILDIDKED